MEANCIRKLQSELGLSQHILVVPCGQLPGAASIPAVTSSTPGGPPGQIRPLVNMNPVAGHGRGDWRSAGVKGAAAMQKGLQAGSGLPMRGHNAAGRGFGGGLEFMLPSQKTIFSVDIDSFEEKPWKYPSVDVSDFFNFGLNEDTWKDYCKQLEQLRLESSMQSKIHVYESGRTEQDYDPDLPPELAAASGIIHDVPVNNANSVTSGQNDLIKGSGPMRPPIPNGRAIQVESGSGERLPSIDTRPPRIRDSDAIIEIVLQDPADDDSNVKIDVQDEQEDGEPQRKDFSEDHVAGHEIPRLESESFNGQKRLLTGRRMPNMKARPINIPVEDENLPFPQEKTIDYSDSRHQTPRQMQGSECDQSPRITCSREVTIIDNKKEESSESMKGRHNAHLSFPAIEDLKESSIKSKQLEETGTTDGTSTVEKEDIDLNIVDNSDTIKDGVAESQKITSQVEEPCLGDGSDWEDSKSVRSSDNSRAKSESSRDYHKQWDGFEVVEDPKSVNLGSIRMQSDENDQAFRRRKQDGGKKPERNGLVIRSREDSYPHKDRHPSSAHQSRIKIDGFDCQRDRVSSDMDWECREDDHFGRSGKNDEPRKDRGDRGRVRENERSNNENTFHSRKELGNGSCRVPYDKDVRSRVSRYKERDDSLKDKHEAVEDFHNKRRTNEEYLKREHVAKEVVRGYRENVSQHKPEKDSILDPRKRDGHQRSRDNLDVQYAARQKNEAWLLRERGNRKRDREEWHQVKQPREEHPFKLERGGQCSVRSGGGVEKILVGHVRAKDEHKVFEKEYQPREAMRPSDRLKTTDQNKSESPLRKGHDDAFVHGNHYNSDERRSREEKSSTRGYCATNALDSQRVHERKRDEGSKKSKETIVGSLGISKRSSEDQSSQINDKGMKGSGDAEHAEDEIPGHRLSRKKHGENNSDDEQKDSQRGRSKYERWTSHKERDFNISSKSSSSLNFKDLDKDNNDRSSEPGKPVDNSTELVYTNNPPVLSIEGKALVDMEIKDAKAKDLEDQHPDTVEKLKKRSERFRVPMASEKETLVIRKLEGEPQPSAENENQMDSEVKQERPPRKRRWIAIAAAADAVAVLNHHREIAKAVKPVAAFQCFCYNPNSCYSNPQEIKGSENIILDLLFGSSFLFQLLNLMSRRTPLPRLLLNNVSCMRNAQQVLRHVNVSLHDGGALVLTGANGSGKTTFLRMLAGFSRPSAGEILWNGHDIQQSAIFHQYKLQLNWLSFKDAINDKFTVLNNVQWFELLENKEGKAMAAVELMGLGKLANEKPRMLSMGQRKRLQLARLLAIDRPIWLLDEPSVALDDEGVKLLEYIIAEHRKHGGIVIVATHLPIEIEDSMVLRLPTRFPRRMTHVDMLDRADIS
ncbi:unnamed protein product [Sphenostylis stenocarpa]|uniref:ABC transporter domain-containing protein n=1 Tax=Sphenostylis stenocarpa TaxID=92480 RepID=A0AA86SA86_9FABA|nr:unnamed protein product [Sphenostylis stenocarpa]